MRATLVEYMGPEDANTGGFVHGGIIMKLCDEAAGLAAMRHCRRPSVTAGMDRMTFTSRVDVGEVVTFEATVNAVWRTSMEVGVRVSAEDLRTGEVRHTSTAYLTMVAIDGDGRPLPVPPLEVPDEDRIAQRRQREAQTRRANRLAEREAFRRAED